ncbi:MOSC N-terminal beta barrel domain-containing protein [Congregibacter brevis]|uniref:MOSC N-terminal beta barrel domain-containing protein n=1 Tax=Congregibacter brevis TaxID=3081201 RepID=A0ABZ0IG61_9GAMM|nr:MOSC N-terminal beta barrel domain-containing protein [Congregibacter sp. IMCC45268]
MQIGQVSDVWMYPVKSMAGHTVDAVQLDELGVIGDRSWSMLDSHGDVAWGKRFPKLMNLEARYVGERPKTRVFAEQVPPVNVRFPDGSEASSDDPINAQISDYVGENLSLSALQSPDNRDHYRWSQPLDEAAIMKILGIASGEAPPDLSDYPEELILLLAECFAPPGTYNDMAPIHLLTTASLRHMSELSGESFDVRRFRPNFLVETNEGVSGLAEFSWIGRRLQIGEVVLEVAAKTIRCSMPARPQQPFDLPGNPKIAKALYEETNRFMGAYLSVVKPGSVSAGDKVMLLS